MEYHLVFINITLDYPIIYYMETLKNIYNNFFTDWLSRLLYNTLFLKL